MLRHPFRTGLVTLLVLAATAVCTAPARAQSAPGGPILVVANDGDPFGRYYAEILRAEGLNEFAVASVGAVDGAEPERLQRGAPGRDRR